MPGADDHDNSCFAPPSRLVADILTAIDQLALADEGSNQPRKVWSLIQPAMSMVQLTNLPRAWLQLRDSYQLKNSADEAPKVHDRNTSPSEAEACNKLELADLGRYRKYAIVRLVGLGDVFYCF
ncbi:hypothetical protein GJ744_008274 [Endocarpon pusillum]|uniref:Uncharacterized protein n=1 Tax=Endocarpon pusillum TaxID=364733 RepID=A0A8H7E3I6_9EURO|nr:hypothetical protein GJ744_008274 [Endocarpon pusillum]